MNVILALESRLTTVNDLPSIGSFFFIDPDLSSSEARSMIEHIAASDYHKILEAVAQRIELTPALDPVTIVDILRDENVKLGLKPMVYMTVLRHALTGMKKGPGVPEIIRVLGKGRTSARLRAVQTVQ